MHLTRRPADGPLLAAEAVTVVLGGRSVLEDVSLALHAGRITTLIGLNGSGKTTLVRVLLGLLKPSSGHVIRRKGLTIGYVPQEVKRDRTLPLTARRFMRMSGSHASAEVARIAAEVGIGQVLDNPLHGLSGGEMRRVLLGRALLRAPDLLVLDEPAAGVDIAGQAELYRLIDGIRRARGCGVLLVSHDLTLVMAATDHVVCLNHRISCEGEPSHVAAHAEFQDLFGRGAAEQLAFYRHRHRHDGEPDSGAAGEDRP
jgi:zinc transport system ATP-binding protein